MMGNFAKPSFWVSEGRSYSCRYLHFDEFLKGDQFVHVSDGSMVVKKLFEEF